MNAEYAKYDHVYLQNMNNSNNSVGLVISTSSGHHNKFILAITTNAVVLRTRTRTHHVRKTRTAIVQYQQDYQQDYCFEQFKKQCFLPKVDFEEINE